MLLSRMNHQTINFGPYRRADGETFEVTAKAYETPTNYDYWRVDFHTIHPEWGTFVFPMVALKKSYKSIEIAKVLAGAAPWDLVKSALDKADASGRPLMYRPFSEDWMMIC